MDWQPLEGWSIARTQTTVGQFRRFVQVAGVQTEAERRGGGEVDDAGWFRKPAWVWHRPFGWPAADDEPAVHVTWYEAQAFCRWAGGRLPRDDEWAGGRLHRAAPRAPPPWRTGQTSRAPRRRRPRAVRWRTRPSPTPTRSQADPETLNLHRLPVDLAPIGQARSRGKANDPERPQQVQSIRRREGRHTMAL